MIKLIRVKVFQLDLGNKINIGYVIKMHSNVEITISARHPAIFTFEPETVFKVRLF